MPEVIWLKDGVPVSKHVTISNAEGCSQILIPSAERSDSGIYSILVKNIVGQETFSVEIRVTGTLELHFIILDIFADLSFIDVRIKMFTYLSYNQSYRSGIFLFYFLAYFYILFSKQLYNQQQNH